MSYKTFLPLSNDIIKSTMNKKNRIFAIPAAPAAIPPKPKTPAIKANTTNVIVQRNILWLFLKLSCLKGLSFLPTL